MIRFVLTALVIYAVWSGWRFYVLTRGRQRNNGTTDAGRKTKPKGEALLPTLQQDPETGVYKPTDSHDENEKSSIQPDKDNGDRNQGSQ